MKKYNIGDIVYVTNYEYKSGKIGQNHMFVIIDDGQAVDINYYGFLLSSKLNKSTYRYNSKLKADNINNLHSDSVVKCDDLIELKESEIQFKVGSVKQSDLNNFVSIFMKFLQEE